MCLLYYVTLCYQREKKWSYWDKFYHLTPRWLVKTHIMRDKLDMRKFWQFRSKQLPCHSPFGRDNFIRINHHFFFLSLFLFLVSLSITRICVAIVYELTTHQKKNVCIHLKTNVMFDEGKWIDVNKRTTVAVSQVRVIINVFKCPLV